MNNTNQSTIKDYYNYIFVELADKRTNDWFLTDFLSVVKVIICYLAFVLYVGPKLMQNRTPFQLKNLLILYNFIQVLVSLYLFFESISGMNDCNYSLKCEPIDTGLTPCGLRAARGVYLYYLAKVSELLDTIFFVLRKKQNQVTFLHCYHHTIMVILTWAGSRYLPGGQSIFIGTANSFVHIWMYAYYMIAAMGPQYKKYIWWKKYLTTIQLVQFVILFFHNSQILFYDCGFPRWAVLFSIPNIILFIYLFADFYKRNYSSKSANEKSFQEKGKLLNGNFGMAEKKVK